jgi:hypothetical protein
LGLDHPLPDAERVAKWIVETRCPPLDDGAKEVLVFAIIDFVLGYGSLRYDEGFQTGYDCANEEQEMASS